jgi:fermentation-respiration switch protein FrsA (DUF1100 family)
MKIQFNKIALILVTFLMTSCAFNKNFLRPIKFQDNVEKLVVNKTATDSMIITFAGKNHQPSFFDKNNQSVTLVYTIESINFPSTNGYLLHGWMLKPKDHNPKATLIHFHGSGSNLLYQMKFVLPLVKKGYQVFIFDYSGYGFSGGKATRKQLLKDGEDAIKYVKTRNEISNLPLFIHGVSYGGNLAICVAAKMQDKVDGIVTEGAFSNHKDLASDGNKKKIMTRLFVKEIYASENYVSQIKKPLLIVHSVDDTVIPFIDAERIYTKAISANKQFLKINGKHLEANASDLDKIDAAIMGMK